MTERGPFIEYIHAIIRDPICDPIQVPNDNQWIFGDGQPRVILTQSISGSCTYVPPDTDCIAQSTYIATPVGFTNPANVTYTFEISGGATIIDVAGNTVTVETTSGSDVGFTLTVTATDGIDTASTEFVSYHSHAPVGMATYNVIDGILNVIHGNQNVVVTL